MVVLFLNTGIIDRIQKQAALTSVLEKKYQRIEHGCYIKRFIRSAVNLNESERHRNT